MLVKNGAFEPHEIAALRDFATARAFDVDWAPGLKSAETNRFNILERPYLYEAATALLGPDPQEFFEDYKFAVTPATDDRPYFFDFFKWRFLPELLGLGPQGAAALLDMGYLILAATLVQAAALSAVLILAPLALRRGLGEAAPRARVVGYFLALGFGFLFLEIAFIQRFILVPRPSALCRGGRARGIPGFRRHRQRHRAPARPPDRRPGAADRHSRRRRCGLGDRLPRGSAAALRGADWIGRSLARS